MDKIPLSFQGRVFSKFTSLSEIRANLEGGEYRSCNRSIIVQCCRDVELDPCVLNSTLPRQYFNGRPKDYFAKIFVHDLGSSGEDVRTFHFLRLSITHHVNIV